MVVEEPTTSLPFGARLIGVPAMVIGEPPGKRVVPSTMRSEEASVKMRPPAVKMGPLLLLLMFVGRVVVEEPTISFPSGAKLTGVPAMVIGEPPGDTVFPSTTRSEEPSVNTRPPAVKMAPLLMLRGRFVVKEPTASFPSEAKLSRAPATVAAGPPGDRVVPSTRTFEDDSVNVKPPSVKTGPSAGADIGRRLVLEDPTNKVPEGPRETDVPEMVAALPPGTSVVPPMAKPVGLAVKVCPPTVKIFAVGTVGALGNIVLDDPTVRTPE